MFCFQREKIYFIVLDPTISFEKYEIYLKWLPELKQKKILQMKYGIDKKAQLFSDLFLRLMACEILNTNNSELICQKDNYGKPSIVGASDFNYNISYSEKIIVIGVSKYPIGLDVERLIFLN